jgi:protein transport protein SEC24
MMEQFESLAIGSTPGQPEVDISALPRPCGAQQEQAYAPAPGIDQANCSPINMRMSVNAIPSSTALKARWPLPLGLIVQPMADDAAGNAVPLVPLGSAGGRQRLTAAPLL